MERETLFIDVILPLAVPNVYTYRVPFDINDEVEVGKRVIVQFGKSRLYTAIIFEIKFKPNKEYTSKYIELILDKTPIVTPKQLRLWEWISNYYLCTIGEVMNAALPANLKISSETVLMAEKKIVLPDVDLTVKEQSLLALIRNSDGIKLKELGNTKSYPAAVRSLIEKKLVFTAEEIKNSYKPRVATFVKLTDGFNSKKGLQKAMDLVSDKEKQLEVLLAYIDISKFFQEEKKNVKRSELLKKLGRSISALNPLIKKDIFHVFKKEISRVKTLDDHVKPLPDLTKDQQQALNAIELNWKKKEVNLLEGVTSSGKTLIYAHLIKQMLARGKQVLYLLPEIGLTDHLISRLGVFFGESIGVYHSKFQKNERVEVWQNVFDQNPKGGRLIVGARSAVFLPFTNLGLIIVDEEHDSSLKQYQPAPRYNARDTAIVMGKMLNAKVLLGSATPAIETRWLAMQGKYGWVRLTSRYGDIKMPEIQIADLKKERAQKSMKGAFSNLLYKLIGYNLDHHHQVILFQNRRGYAPLWVCQTCGWIPKCTDCDVNLTYHSHSHQLVCHYCSKSYLPPKQCLACGSSRLKMPGYGTERIEEELNELFPKAIIARVDLDTTRKRTNYEKIIERVEERIIDIVIGTQMISKGLDFNNVQLVGILNADQMLNFPDFRAFERAFQMMVQVAGRAGRLNKRGMVVIQTSYPDHKIIKDVINHDYDAFYKSEIEERKKYMYPPFYRLIQITLIDKNKSRVKEAADLLAESLRTKLDKRVLGPEFPYISRIRNKYHIHVLLKLERSMSPDKVRDFIKDKITDIHAIKEYRYVRIYADVDPV
jgi:primosomal protein N' (replication factor Y)